MLKLIALQDGGPLQSFPLYRRSVSPKNTVRRLPGVKQDCLENLFRSLLQRLAFLHFLFSECQKQRWWLHYFDAKPYLFSRQTLWQYRGAAFWKELLFVSLFQV